MPSTRFVSVSIDVLDYANETRLEKVTVTIQAVAATEGPWVLPARCSESSVVATSFPKDEVVLQETRGQHHAWPPRVTLEYDG
jgi:hypothetical protein